MKKLSSLSTRTRHFRAFTVTKGTASSSNAFLYSYPWYVLLTSLDPFHELKQTLVSIRFSLDEGHAS